MGICADPLHIRPLNCSDLGQILEHKPLAMFELIAVMLHLSVVVGLNVTGD